MEVDWYVWIFGGNCQGILVLSNSKENDRAGNGIHKPLCYLALWCSYARVKIAGKFREDNVEKHTWKPVFRLTTFFGSPPESRSGSSSALTLFKVWHLTMETLLLW
jgi:hypothetical protein